MLTKPQRQNYYCIMSTLINSNAADTVKNELFSCFKETAKYFKEEVKAEIIYKNLSILNSKY